MKIRFLFAAMVLWCLFWACDEVGSLLDPYQAPVITGITENDDEVSPGDTVTISVEATNPEQGILLFEWSSPQGGRFILPADDSTARWIAPVQGGTYRITVRVSNEKKTTEAYVDIIVLSTEKPVVRIHTPEHGKHFAQYSMITVQAEAYHQNGLSGIWLFIDGGLKESASYSATNQYMFTFLADSGLLGPTEIKIVAQAGQTPVVGEDMITIYIEGIIPGKGGQ